MTLDRLKDEPVGIAGVVVAVVAILAGFGLELDPEAVAGFVVLAELVVSYVVRRKVTPTGTLEEKLVLLAELLEEGSEEPPGT